MLKKIRLSLKFLKFLPIISRLSADFSRHARDFHRHDCDADWFQYSDQLKISKSSSLPSLSMLLTVIIFALVFRQNDFALCRKKTLCSLHFRLPKIFPEIVWIIAYPSMVQQLWRAMFLTFFIFALQNCFFLPFAKKKNGSTQQCATKNFL